MNYLCSTALLLALSLFSINPESDGLNVSAIEKGITASKNLPNITTKLVSLFRYDLMFMGLSGSLSTIQCQTIATDTRHLNYDEAENHFIFDPRRVSFYENVSKSISKGKSAMCSVTVDYFQLYLEWSEYLVNTTLTNLTIDGGDDYLCEYSNDAKCDKFSVCMTDECRCKNGQLMFCPIENGGVACIAFANVCNGVVDCADGRDECFCQDSYKLTCHRFLQIKQLCLPQLPYCKNLEFIKELDCEGHPLDVNCTDVIDKWDNSEIGNPLSRCLFDEATSGNLYDLYNTGTTGDKACRALCTKTTELMKWENFCDNILLHFNPILTPMFICDSTNKSDESEGIFAAHLVCDGKVHCSNKADELGCPGRFYCSITEEIVSWIDQSRVCDKRKDCTNGNDECSGCSMDGLASTQFLIKSKVIGAFTILVGIGIITINIYVGYKTYRHSCNSKAAQIDRLLRLQICFYDLLMGLYLLLLVIAAIVLRVKGDYCSFDEEWRASIPCMQLGLVFTISSHGSLLVIALMSIIRCINCTSSISADFSIRKIMSISLVVSLLNIFHAILPILPVAQVQNLFRTSIYLVAVEKNPFMVTREGSDMIEHARIIHSHYYDNSSSSNTAKLFADLKHANITSDDTIFDISDIGYYGNTPLCIFNIFKKQENYQLYKLVYCIALTALLAAVTVAYVVIVYKTRESHQAAGPQNNDTTTQLTLKVSLMITSQLASWVSFIATVVIFAWVIESDPPKRVFEIFALIVIPINSLLNPIFYSGLYQSMTSCLWETWRKFVERMQVQNRQGDM